MRDYPRIRFMGSKYRLAPRLAEVFATLPPGPAIDAFSGSGVVAYTLKASGREVLANDHLTFTSTLAEALVANQDEQLTAEDVERLCSPSRDGRDFIAAHVRRALLPPADHAFLDAAWSHVDEFSGAKRALALSALCLAAAQKQPRGVFTVTTPRYDDGRRQFRMSLEALFREAVDRCNAAVIPGPACGAAAATCSTSTSRRAIAYLDPPYAPPRDDTCYVKRYHFLEGLATYWRGQEIMWETRTRKLVKRPHAVRLQAHRRRRARPPVRPLRHRGGPRRLLRLQRRADRRGPRSPAQAPPALGRARTRSRIATRSAPTAPPNGASPRNTCSSAANAAG